MAETKASKKGTVLKILLLLAILVAIAAIWLVKNKNVSAQEATSTEPAESTDDAQASEATDDFALEAESIDLAKLLAYELPIIIDFGSDSCIPCQQMAPVLQSANADYRGKAIIKFVDVWKYTDAADGFPVQVIPTQILINADGTPYVPSEDLGIEFIMYTTKDTQEHVFTAHQGGLSEEQMDAILADMGAGE